MVIVYGQEVTKTTLTRKAVFQDYWIPVPETDTGRLVENTKVREITLSKELGKMPS